MGPHRIIMLRVRRHPKLALLESNNTVDAHNTRHTILGTTHMLYVMQFIPNPWTTVVALIPQEHPFYLNEQLLVINTVLTLRSIPKRVIPAPRHFHCTAHLLKRKDQTILVYEPEPFSVGFENMPTAFFSMSRSISTSRNFRRRAAISLKLPLPGKAFSPLSLNFFFQRYIWFWSIPRLRATSAALWPPSVTILTAAILKSRSNRFFFPSSPCIGHLLVLSWLSYSHHLFVVSTFSGEDQTSANIVPIKPPTARKTEFASSNFEK